MLTLPKWMPNRWASLMPFLDMEQLFKLGFRPKLMIYFYYSQLKLPWVFFCKLTHDANSNMIEIIFHQMHGGFDPPTLQITQLDKESLKKLW